ncbi:MAG TPA: hypothetical protein VGZ47_02645 [Gemmataceae bacterium]|nr:hypothetical protein [Gemmataceae bacterium]
MVNLQGRGGSRECEDQCKTAARRIPEGLQKIVMTPIPSDRSGKPLFAPVAKCASLVFGLHAGTFALHPEFLVLHAGVGLLATVSPALQCKTKSTKSKSLQYEDFEGFAQKKWAALLSYLAFFNINFGRFFSLYFSKRMLRW